MVEKARQDVDQLRQELAKSSDTTLQREIDSKVKLLNNLEDHVRHSKFAQVILVRRVQGVFPLFFIEVNLEAVL